MVQSDKRLLWHPRHENKFIVGGSSQITLYEWLPRPSQIRQVASQLDLSHMKCFAWSPDPLVDDLVAVGQSTGRVDLLRLEAPKLVQNNGSNNVAATSLPARNSRACNALAFSPADPNYLAVGLDKVRGDGSLVIWDIQSAFPALSINLAQRPSPGLPRVGDAGTRGADQRIVQQHASAEVVSSVAWLPDSAHLLLAGISHRWLRLFDLRNPGPQGTGIASKVHGIVTDPFDAHRIACFGEGVVSIWDVRRLSQHPMLTFTAKDLSVDGLHGGQAAGGTPRAKGPGSPLLTTVEFSSVRRGTLATLERDATCVRFWDVLQAQTVEATREQTRSRDSSVSGKAPKLSWANPLGWSGSTSSPAASPAVPAPNVPAEPAPYNLILADTRKTKAFPRPIASFALLPSPHGTRHPLTSNVMLVNKDGDLELYAVHDTPLHSPWSARGELAVGIACSYRVIPGITDPSPPPEPWDILVHPQTSLPGSHAHSLERSRTRDRSRGISLPGASISSSRGRTSISTPPSQSSRASPATFGRGDEEGFPALSPSKPEPGASIAVRERTSSPVVRSFEHTVLGKGWDGRARGRSRGRTEREGPVGGDQLRPPPTPHTATIVLEGKHVNERLRVIKHIVEEDISMLMRQRVIKGYGLANPLHNSMVALETSPEAVTLAEVWHWIHHADGLVSSPSPIIDGYNFAYQGVLGIWDGLRSTRTLALSEQATPRAAQRNSLLDVPSPLISSLTLETPRVHSRPGSKRPHGGHGRKRSQPVAGVPDEFLAAVEELNARNVVDGEGMMAWKPSVSTARLAQRRFALQLCGWSLAQDDLARAIKRWEKENRHSQAACWLAFTEQHSQAVEMLMRSQDESHHMMSGMLAALAPSSSGSPSRNPDLLQHCERLIVRLQDPYLRALLTHLTVRDWTEVLEEDTLPLRERLAIALQFLEDKDMGAYLRRVADRTTHEGDIEGLIVTGLTERGMELLQTYADVSGDVQSAALFAGLNPAAAGLGAQEGKTARWLDAYRDLLDGWRLFHHRCQLDIDRGRILKEAMDRGDVRPFEWAPKQVLLRCNYCGKPMDPPFSAEGNLRATLCPHCSRPLPRCSICLMTLSLTPEAPRAGGVPSGTIEDALVFCQTCRHGGHASHLLDWFYGEERSHGTCPVAGCDCRCADEM